MKDEKGRQIIRTDKKGIEERKMNNDVVPQKKLITPQRRRISRLVLIIVDK